MSARAAGDPEAGARAALAASGARRGERLAVLAEDPAAGLYEPAVAGRIAAAAEAAGLRARIHAVPHVDSIEALPPEARAALLGADRVVLLCRLGDSLRFSETGAAGTALLCHVLDEETLGSPACTLPDALLAELHRRLEARFAAASRWRLRCPRGTDLSGSTAAADPAGAGAAAGAPAGAAPSKAPPQAAPSKAPPQAGSAGFSMRVFPRGSFRPVPAADAEGTIAPADWVIGTGNRLSTEAPLRLEGGLTARLEGGRIRGAEGPDAEREAARRARVAEALGIAGEADVVHSWHAGLNPQAFSARRAEEDPERWGVAVLGSPGHLHFHVCGDYAPGEVCWSLRGFDVDLDGEALWRGGRCLFLEEPAQRALAREHGVDERLLTEARADLGL